MTEEAADRVGTATAWVLTNGRQGMVLRTACTDAVGVWTLPETEIGVADVARAAQELRDRDHYSSYVWRVVKLAGPVVTRWGGKVTRLTDPARWVEAQVLSALETANFLGARSWFPGTAQTDREKLTPRPVTPTERAQVRAALELALARVSDESDPLDGLFFRAGSEPTFDEKGFQAIDVARLELAQLRDDSGDGWDTDAAEGVGWGVAVLVERAREVNVVETPYGPFDYTCDFELKSVLDPA